MRSIKLTIQYDGTRYAGWQYQKNARSVQRVIERALRKIVSEKVKIIGASRTDAGVHALGQVAHFKTRSSLSPGSIKKALNGILPDDIVIACARVVPDSFHAQFGARSKRYRYTIVQGGAVSPFIRKYAADIRAPLDMRRMKQAARCIVGRHDFRAFQTHSSAYRGDSVRTVGGLSIRKSGPRIYIDIEADGFLYTMARCIVGTLIEVGRGRFAPAMVGQIMRSRNRRRAGPTAPAKGLCLVKVRYGRLSGSRPSSRTQS